jgi:hypothetical protein
MLRPSRLLTAVLAAALAAGCAADSGDTTVLVLGNMAPAPGCTFTAALTGPFISGGTLDLSLDRVNMVTTVQRGYEFAPLIENESVADTSNQSLVARRTLIVQGAHVDISFNDTVEFSMDQQAMLRDMGLTHFDSLFAGSVQPNGGLGVFTFELLPAALIDKILADHPLGTGPYMPFAPIGVVAKVVVYGTLGGGATASLEFDYPVTVCDTCLIQNQGACASLPSGFMARTGGACESNQDAVTDCCTTATGALVCPASATATGP